MLRVPRWLYAITLIALLCGLAAIIQVARLTGMLRHVVATDSLVIPSQIGTVHTTGGIASSQDGEEMVLWLGRMNTNAQTRLSVRKNGSQSLEFFDGRGKLRLKIGIDAAGRTQMQSFDERGRPQPLSGS